MKPWALLFLIFCATLASAGDDWKTKRCAEPADVVFKAADRAVAEHYKIELSDPARGIIRFKVGMTAWAYGYTMTLRVDRAANDTSVISAFMERKGSWVLSWGKGKSELLRVYSAIDDELVRAKQEAPAASK